MTPLLAGYLLLAWAAGVALTFLSRVSWRLEGRLAMGIPVGFAAAALVTWVVAIPVGMSGLPVAVGALGLAVIVAACARWTPWRPTLATEARSLVQRWRSGAEVPLAILLVLALVYFIPFFSRALVLHPDGLYANYVTVWGDWATHLTLSGYLSDARHLLPPPSPWFAGTNITYSFLPDFFSAIQTHLGITTVQSLPLTSAIMSLAFVVIFYSVALYFTRSRWAAFLAACLFFMSGGTGLFRVFGDAAVAGATQGGGFFGGLLQVISHPPRQYTQDIPANYQWLTPVLAYLVPQRTTLFGWPLGMLTLVLLWHGWTQRSRRELLLAGIVIGLIPLLHIATYADMLVIGGGFAGFTAILALRRGDFWRTVVLWLYFFVPALVIGPPQILMVVPHAPYSLPFIRLQPGWLADPAGWKHDGLFGITSLTISFWLQNTGALMLLALAGLFLMWRRRARAALLLAPAWILFIAPNIAALAPWDWDNTKYFVWWAMPASMLAGLALYRLARVGRLAAVAAVAVLVFQVGAGALDLNRAWQPLAACGTVCSGGDSASHMTLGTNEIRFLDADELALAAWVRTDTPREAVFLTAQQHNHPVVTMGHRVETLGFLGDLYSWGVNYNPRYLDVLAMYRGGADAVTLLNRYHVSYIVVGPTEARDLGADAARLARQFGVAYRSPSGEYEVFRVSGA